MLRSRVCVCVLCAISAWILALLLLFSPQAAHAQAPGKGPVSFINDVAPILKENCFACHDAKKRKGKFDMTTFESFRKGGDQDDPIKPGKPDDSYLIDAVKGENAPRMPPKESGDALPKEKIAVHRPVDQGRGQARRRPDGQGRSAAASCASAGSRRRRPSSTRSR